MTTFDGIAGRFLALHSGDRPLLQPNAWDAGSARILASMGFEAIATTSSGFAATLGRADGRVTRDEALAHAAALSAAVDVPVAADTENGRSEEHTSELQSLMRISYAVFCLEKKNTETY